MAKKVLIGSILIIIIVIGLVASQNSELVGDPEFTSENEHNTPKEYTGALPPHQQERIESLPVIDSEQPNGTQLQQLALLGLVKSSERTQSSATIRSNIQTRTYYIGDQIAYTRATLTEVLNDRVIVSLDEQEYVLLLKGSMTGNTHASATVSEDNQITQQQREIARQIGSRPQKLEHIFSLTELPDDSGFAVAPGLNPSLFKSALFKPGDILQKVNGLELTDPQQYQQVVSMLPQAQELVFTVKRGNRTITLYLDIPSKGLTLGK